MLTKVVIHRFRSCVDLTLDDLGPTVVLVGRNGTGKTNILRAIEAVTSSALDSGKALDRPMDGSSTRVEFSVGDRSYSYEIDIPNTLRGRFNRRTLLPIGFRETIQVCNVGEDWRTIAIRNDGDIELLDGGLPEGKAFQINPGVPFMPFLLSYLTPGEPLLEDLHRVEEFLREIRYYPLDESSTSVEQSRYIPENEYNEWLARFQATGDAGDMIIFKLLYMCLNPDQGEFEEVSGLLGLDGLGLVENIVPRTISTSGRRDDETTNTTPVPTPPPAPSYYIIWFLLPGYPDTNRAVFFENLSLGTRRIIRLIVSMIFDKSSVMLVEHPEDGIHRALTRQVFSRLKSYTEPMQLIATSHSELVFQLLDPTEVRLVTMEDGATKARALTVEEVGEAKRFVEETGPLADFLEMQFGI